MPEVECKVERVEILNERDEEVHGVRLTCSRCGHQTESFGRRGRSVRRCLVLMREECPEGCKGNYYVPDREVDD